MSTEEIAQQKKAAGEYAANLVTDGMIVGLGTGSTVKYFIERLAQRIFEEGLEVTGVTTSNRTFAYASQLGIVLKDIDDVPYIEMTIDGADEVDQHLNGIKGGGAALLFEKIVALTSKKNIWIVDESKVHEHLGHFPLPVEVIPLGVGQLLKRWEQRGFNPVLRLHDGEPVVTDTGHYVIDLHLERIPEPGILASELQNQIGVVEHGLFLGIADEIIIGGKQVKVIKK
jgi:ribose 5-phosphate isomerase A